MQMLPQHRLKLLAEALQAGMLAACATAKARTLCPDLPAVQDGTVVAWSEKPDGSWTRTLVHDFGAPVWRVSWSVTGE